MSAAAQKILLITEHALRGGAETSTLLLAEGLAEQGLQVEVGFGWRGEMLQSARARGIRLPLGTGPRVPGRARLRLPGLLLAAARRHDIVHVSALEHRSTLAGATAARLGRTVIAHLRNPWQLDRAQRLHDLGAGVITNSSATRDALLASGRQRVWFVPNGIDPVPLEQAAAAVTAPARTAALAEFGIPAGARVAICVANLAPYKAVDSMMRTVAAAMRRDPALHLLHVGDTYFASTRPVREAVEREVASSGAAERFHLLGRRDDAIELTALADLVLVPSTGEGTARAILEGWSCGRPVVAARADGLVDLIHDGRNGRLIDLGRPEEGAQVMLDVLDDASESSRLVSQARVDVHERYSHAAHLTAVLRVYAEMLGLRGEILNVAAEALDNRAELQPETVEERTEMLEEQ